MASRCALHGFVYCTSRLDFEWFRSIPFEHRNIFWRELHLKKAKFSSKWRRITIRLERRNTFDSRFVVWNSNGEMDYSFCLQTVQTLSRLVQIFCTTFVANDPRMKQFVFNTKCFKSVIHYTWFIPPVIPWCCEVFPRLHRRGSTEHPGSLRYWGGREGYRMGSRVGNA